MLKDAILSRAELDAELVRAGFPLIDPDAPIEPELWAAEVGAEAQHRATLRAVVKYLDEPCTTRGHGRDVYTGQAFERVCEDHRYSCPKCMAALRQAAGGE